MIIISIPRQDSVENDIVGCDTKEEAREAIVERYFHHNALLRIVGGPDYFREKEKIHREYTAEYEFLARLFWARAGEFVGIETDDYELAHIEHLAMKLEDKSEYGFDALNWFEADFCEDQYDCIFDYCTSPYGRPQIDYIDSKSTVEQIALHLLTEIYNTDRPDDWDEEFRGTVEIPAGLIRRIDEFCFKYMRGEF